MKPNLPLLVALAAAVAPASLPALEPTPLSLPEYRASLRVLADSIEAGEPDRARAAALALRGAQVRSGQASFEADPTIVEAVVAMREAGAAARARRRILLVLATLDETAPAPEAVDKVLLSRLLQEQAARQVKPEADASSRPSLPSPSLPQRVRAWLDAVRDFLRRVWRWLYRLLSRLFRGEHRTAEPTGTAGGVAVLVALIIVVLAAALILARRHRGEASLSEQVGEGLASRDEDPLSREATEWERYAAELAREGRRREAIRAWYHAVLVTLFRTGTLNYQKGRTNWEYVFAVGPESAWRPSFESLTRSFEREWYGRDASVGEALRECQARAKEILGRLRGEAPA